MCCSWLQWKVDKGVFFPCFSFKKKKKKEAWKKQPSHKEVGTKTPRCALLKAFRKKCFTDRTLLSIQFGLSVLRVTDLEKFPVWISKDEAPTPLPVVGPLFISLLSFHLSRALLGAWRFGLFRCVYSSFRNRLDLIREPAFYFIFPIYPCLFHHV